MPKLIENIRQQLIAEVRTQISERGYSQTTVRSVAAACGVGVGTVYNYFKSKEHLVATAVAEDWEVSVKHFKSSFPKNSMELLKSLYKMLDEFAKAHNDLFSDPEASKKYNSIFGERHQMLREQVSLLILPICKKNDDPEFCSAFVAEALITWCMAGEPFEKIYNILEKIILKEIKHEQL